MPAPTQQDELSYGERFPPSNATRIAQAHRARYLAALASEQPSPHLMDYLFSVRAEIIAALEAGHTHKTIHRWACFEFDSPLSFSYAYFSRSLTRFRELIGLPRRPSVAYLTKNVLIVPSASVPKAPDVETPVATEQSLSSTLCSDVKHPSSQMLESSSMPPNLAPPAPVQTHMESTHDTDRSLKDHQIIEVPASPLKTSSNRVAVPVAPRLGAALPKGSAAAFIAGLRNHSPTLVNVTSPDERAQQRMRDRELMVQKEFVAENAVAAP